MSFLDGERFIGEAVESVLAQTFEDWELLLVDDGSQDESRAIASQYAARDPNRIRVLWHGDGKNHGIAASRNLGFRAARGQYVALLDADDVYEPRRLERHVECLDLDPGLGVVISDELYWYSWAPDSERRPDLEDRILGPAVEPGRRYEPPTFIVSCLLTPGAPLPSPCSVTFRRATVLRVGGIPESFRGHYEDQVLFCKLLLAEPAMVLAECLARYRQHAGSVTQGNAPSQDAPGSPALRAREGFLVWLRQYLSDEGHRIPALSRWIDAELALLAGWGRSTGSSLRFRLMTRVLAGLPAGMAHSLRHVRRAMQQAGTRRKVMRRIRSFEQANTSEPVAAVTAIQRYWDARIDDMRLSDDPPGSPDFYAALDAYHLEKCDYLLREIAFGAWLGRDVLEIGCGSGLDLVRFARGGARITGVDLSCAAIELARGYCRSAGVAACLLEGDGARLPFPSGSFDLVYCMGVLPFAADPVAIVAEAHRVLRPGGEAIFMVYNRRSWMNLVATLTGRREGHTDAPGFHLYNHAQFDRLLSTFPERRIVAERFPVPSNRRRALPGVLWRPYGWHLLAFCRKDL